MPKPEFKYLYNSKRWKDIRLSILLRDQYQCAVCGKAVSDNPKHPHAAVVNHKQKHEGNVELFFDPTNLECVGKSCHDGHIQSLEKGGQGKPIIGEDGWPIEPAQ